jgi:2-haloacid dehalogenase
MRPPPEIQALAFDAYGTLFDLRPLGTLCQELFPGRGAELGRLWRAKQVEYAWLLTLTGLYEDFWHVTDAALTFACRALGLSCPSATRDRLMDAYLHLRPYPDVIPALKALSEFTLVIVSNGTPQMLHAAVARAGLEGMFSHIISVEEAKAYKPSPQAYRLACQKTGLDKDRIGFVSSNAWDVIGAKAFGYWTCWVNRDDSPGEELGFVPDLTVLSLPELAEHTTPTFS